MFCLRKKADPFEELNRAHYARYVPPIVRDFNHIGQMVKRSVLALLRKSCNKSETVSHRNRIVNFMIGERYANGSDPRKYGWKQ